MIVTKTPIPKGFLQLNPGDYIIDIETTGFSAKFAAIYMIGFICFEDGQLTAQQWLAEKESDEYEMLFKLAALMEHQPLMCHYNGDQFDMPFIRQRMELYGMTLPGYRSLDFMKLARPYKKALGLDNLKLKTIEAYFGYERDDPYTGGDLIKVYKTYLQNKDRALQQMLLLHNYEDLLGLRDVMSHLPLFQLLDSFKEQAVNPDLHSSSIENGLYSAKFMTELKQGSYKLENEHFKLSLKDGEAIFTTDTTVSEMYYFFPDPKNYYYLPNEDYAVHKSLGQFVAKDHRLQATKANAYVKKDGFFLPCGNPRQAPFPLYFPDPDSKEAYVAVEDLMETDSFQLYIQWLLKQL